MTRRTPNQYDYAKLQFDETLLPKHFSSLGSKDVEFIVIHHMTIQGIGSGSALDACFQVWMSRKASAHYGVDGKYIRQFVWDKDFAWATGSTYGNLHGISIEHANSTPGPGWLVSDETWKNGARLAAALHVVYGLGRPVKDKTLRRHSSFTSTACPGPYLGGKIWNDYFLEVVRVYDVMTGAKPDVPPVVVVPVPAEKNTAKWSDPSSFVIGASGPDVTRLGDRVVVWSKYFGLPAPYKVGPGPSFTEVDRLAVSRLQLKFWPKASTKPGGDADGFPGSQLLALIAKDPATPTVPTGEEWTLAGWNVAGMNALGRATVKKRNINIVDTLARSGADVVCVNELSNPNVAAFAKLMAAKGFKLAPGGSDGRYIFARSSLKIGASGVFDLQPRYKKNDKQAAWAAVQVGGTWKLIVTPHLEYRSGADNERVGQAKSALSQAQSKAKSIGVQAEDIIIAGDMNSDTWVTTKALNPANYVDVFSVAAKTFNAARKSFAGWTGTIKNGHHIDVVGVHRNGPKVLTATIDVESRTTTKRMTSDHLMTVVTFKG